MFTVLYGVPPQETDASSSKKQCERVNIEI